jgi:DNA-binding CsgD family transcriptional regulator
MNHSGNLQSVQSREFFAISEFLFLLYQIEPGSSFGDHVVRCFNKVFPDLKISCHQVASDKYLATEAIPGWARWSQPLFQEAAGHSPSIAYVKVEGTERVLMTSGWAAQQELIQTNFAMEGRIGIRRHEKALDPLDRTVTRLGSGFDQSITEENQNLFCALMPHIRNASQIAARISPKETSTNDLERFDLTPREKEVALWMKEGKRDKEIAVILGISSRTVEKHVHQILEKLQVENRSSAIAVLTEARLTWNILRDSLPAHGRTKP